MAISDSQFTAAWTEVLTLSKVKPGEQVTLLTSVDTNKQTLSCATMAATGLGAIVTVLELPPTNGEISLSRDKLAYVGPTALAGNKAAMSALKNSDLVIDLMLLLFSPEQGEILAGGTRMLLAVEPARNPDARDSDPGGSPAGARGHRTLEARPDHDGNVQGRYRSTV